jgi:hypothetical protein
MSKNNQVALNQANPDLFYETLVFKKYMLYFCIVDVYLDVHDTNVASWNLHPTEVFFL